MTTFVSIVLPTLNVGKTIQESIESCLEQTYSNFELLVVDGGSIDNTLEIVRHYSDSRIKIISQQNNQGRLPGALNLGFSQTQGDYLTWMQGDCKYHPEAIATMVRYLDDHPDVDFVYAPFWIINDAGEKLELIGVKTPDTLLDNNDIGNCFLYRRRVYEVIGDYDVNAYLAEDYEYWMRVAQKFHMKPLADPLFYYRLGESALSTKPGVVYKRLRLGAKYKWERFGWPWYRYWLEMSRIDIDEAFHHYKNANYRFVPSLMLRGLARNPAWLLNKGVTAILFKAFLKQRKASK